MSNQRRIDELRTKIGRYFDEYGIRDMPSSVAAEIKDLNAELERLVSNSQIQRVLRSTKALNDYYDRPVGSMRHPSGGGGDAPYAGKSLGELFVESDAFRGFTGREAPTVELKDVSLKTLFQTTAGWAPESVRGPRVELTAERALVVADLPMLSETDQAAVKYMEETTKTPAAAETAEAGTYPEAAFALTERSSTVRKIAVFIPVTDEQFADEQRARDYINNRLVRAINERLDSQLLTGDGTAPNLTGILNVSGIQTQAKGVDPAFDAILKAINKVRFTGYAEPDAIVLHPNDWESIRLTRTAGDGIYIHGDPISGGPERLWGLPVVVTPAITENTGLVGAFRAYSELVVRQGIEVKVSDSHSTYFVEGKLAVRADFRCAFVTYRAAAFCTVTGL